MYDINNCIEDDGIFHQFIYHPIHIVYHDSGFVLPSLFDKQTNFHGLIELIVQWEREMALLNAWTSIS